jgi:hypothetical protein
MLFDQGTCLLLAWEQVTDYCSAAMLKKRIRKWDLDRNNKHADMVFALKLAFEREAMGKETFFRIRGRLVTFQDVKHYFHRKGIRDLKAVVSAIVNPSPTTQINCRTPEPEMPIRGRATHDPETTESVEEPIPPRNFTENDIDASYSVMAFPDPDQVNLIMTATSPFSDVEQLLYLGRAYYDAIFDNPGWRNNHYSFDVDSLEIFYHHMFDGQRLLEENNITEAFVRLDDGFDMIRSLLYQQVLLFLPYLYHLLLPGRATYAPEIVTGLLSFTSQMASICSPQLHPIRQSLTLLGRMLPEDRGESSRLLFQNVLDRVEIEFDDIPEPLEMDLNLLCSRLWTASPAGQDVDNYKLTSIAVRSLARDADKLWGLGTEPSQTAIAEDELTLRCKSMARRLNMERFQNSASTAKISHLY